MGLLPQKLALKSAFVYGFATALRASNFFCSFHSFYDDLVLQDSVYCLVGLQSSNNQEERSVEEWKIELLLLLLKLSSTCTSFET